MKFHLRDVLVVITGKQLPSSENGSGIRNLLDHMLGEEQEGLDPELAVCECQNALLNQHPELAEAAVNFLNNKPAPNQMINVVPLTDEAKGRILKASQAKRVGRV